MKARLFMIIVAVGLSMLDINRLTLSSLQCSFSIPQVIFKHEQEQFSQSNDIVATVQATATEPIPSGINSLLLIYSTTCLHF